MALRKSRKRIASRWSSASWKTPDLDVHFTDPWQSQDPHASHRLSKVDAPSPRLGVGNSASTSRSSSVVRKPPKPANPPQQDESREPERPLAETLRAEQHVTIGSRRTIDMGGIRNKAGDRFIWCREGTRFVLTRYADWHVGGGDASAKLRAHGLVVIRGMPELRDAADQLKRFPTRPVISRPGWSDINFALPNGTIIHSAGTPEPLKDFAAVNGILDHAGSLEGWIEGVAAPLADHLLASFFMMAMFAAPLLRFTNRADNFGIELAGEAGRGKSTLQRLMASAAGPAIGDGDATYWRSLHSTINALELVLATFNDLPLILDEAGLVPGAGKTDTRGAAMREIAFRFSAGRVKDRVGEVSGPRSRTIPILSTNRPISSLGGHSFANEGHAIADRIITVPLNGRAHGIFDECPPSFPTTGEFASALEHAAANHYGCAMPAYLSYLVEEQARRPRKLKRRIADHISEFVKHVGVNTNDGSQKRVGEAFGLIYAAGRLGKDAGVLPSAYRCRKATNAVYQLHQAHGRPLVTFEDKIKSVMAHPYTIDLAKSPIKSMTKSAISRCQAFIYVGRSRTIELVVPIHYINRVFPGWNVMREDEEVLGRLRKAGDRIALERPIGPGGEQSACYVFDVTDLRM